MLKYLQKRLVLAIPTVLFTSLVVFLMLYLIPGDPASIYVGENKATPERLDEIRHAMGLDRPLYVQYADFIWKGLHGDLGRSLQTSRPVLDEIVSRFPNTVQLAVAAMAIGILLGVTLGIIAGLFQNSWLDSLAMLVAICGISIPVFWLGLLLIMLFAVRLHVLPATSDASLGGLI